MLYPQNNICRRTWKLDGYWDFQLDPSNIGVDEQWEQGLPAGLPIGVPASWNEQSIDYYHYRGIAWYERCECIPVLEQGQRVLLRFSNVQFAADVYVNGLYIGTNERAYLPFEWDITEFAMPGETNRITVRVSGTISPDEPVKICDFYGFAGISRPVFISIVNERRIADITVSTKAAESGWYADIDIQAGSDTTAVAYIEGHAFALAPADSGHQGQAYLEGAIPWDCDNPKLYTLTVALFHGGSRVDEYSLRIGFRDISVRGRQILLNGQPVYLTGFGKHEDFPIVGKGLVHALNIRDFTAMKWCGANSFRTTHYPYSEEIMDLADQMGILVIDEAPFAGLDSNHFKNQATRAKALEYMGALIARDKNHPCILSWSVGNECQSDCTEAKDFFLPVIQLARALDSRPITYVAWTKPEEDVIYQHVDIVGFNRYYGWYAYENWPGSAKPGNLDAALAQLDECLEQFAAQYDGPLILTEFGADTIEGFHSPFCLQFTEEFQTEFLSRYIQLIRSKSFITGMHVWCFADFATGQSPGRVLGNRKGVFTRTREPKMAAITLRGLWSGDK